VTLYLADSSRDHNNPGSDPRPNKSRGAPSDRNDSMAQKLTFLPQAQLHIPQYEIRRATRRDSFDGFEEEYEYLAQVN